MGVVSFYNYDELFFIIIGILVLIGILVDKIVYVLLVGIEVMYLLLV